MSPNDPSRIHPTQKPIALYKWILAKYAKPGDKILDTHVGSASSLIACHEKGFQYVGFELDPDYYRAAKERLDKARAQVSIFDAQTKARAEQLTMIGGGSGA
jgi:site-specific DNA-methyltransferase (adenine-specific)